MGLELNFSKNFIEILKQFQKISDQMYFNHGYKQSVIAESKRVFAQSITDVEVEKPFAIYSLKKFLSVLSLYEEPKIVINDNVMIISSNDDRKTCHYQLTNPEYIVYEKNLDKFNKKYDFSFEMKSADYMEIDEIASVLKSNLIIFRGDGKSVNVTCEKSQSGDVGLVALGETSEIFKAALPIDVLKMKDEDYIVEISRKGSIRFISEKITYLFALDKDNSSL